MFVGGFTEIGWKPPIKPYKRMLPTKNIRYVKDPEHVKRIIRVWDNYTEIGEIIVTPTKKFVVGVGARDGQKVLTIRAWYSRIGEDHFIPTFNAISIPISLNIEGEHLWPMSDLPDLISKALTEAEDLPIYDAENEVWTAKKKKRRMR